MFSVRAVNGKRVLLLGLAFAALAAVAALLTSGGHVGLRADAGLPTPLSNLFPPGANITPGPTSTPIAPPQGVGLITESEARAIGLRVAGLSGDSVDASSVSSQLRTAADTGHTNGHVPDYPLWFISAKGIFHPSFGNGQGTFSTITVYIDAITGSIFGVEMRDQLRVPSPRPAAWLPMIH